MQDEPNPSGLCKCGCGGTTPLSKWTDKRIGLVKGRHANYIKGHRASMRSPRWIVDPKTGCWEWQKAKNRKGYGFVASRKSTGEKSITLAHRLTYEQTFGPIPEGKCIDHMCCNPACVNPYHLDVVTKGENNRRMLLRGRAWWQRV